MKKKLVAMLLVTAMAIAAGCGNSGESSDTKEDTGSTADGGLIPVTFVRQQDPMAESNVFAHLKDQSYEKNVWTDLIADELGYEVQYSWIASSADLYTQKFNAAIASGDIPDIAIVDKSNLKRLVEADLIVDLEPYIEEYASDYLKELLQAGGDAAIKACTIDGVQYGLPYLDCDMETTQIL